MKAFVVLLLLFTSLVLAAKLNKAAATASALYTSDKVLAADAVLDPATVCNDCDPRAQVVVYQPDENGKKTIIYCDVSDPAMASTYGSEGFAICINAEFVCMPTMKGNRRR